MHICVCLCMYVYIFIITKLNYVEWKNGVKTCCWFPCKSLQIAVPE